MWIISFTVLAMLLFSSGIVVVMSAGLWPIVSGLDDKSSGSGLRPDWKKILFSGIPGLNGTSPSNPVVINSVSATQGVLYDMFMLLTNIDIRDAKSWVRAEIPFLQTVPKGNVPVTAKALPNFPQFDARMLSPAGKPLVAIYHTHTAESFIPSSGVTHRPGGQHGEIVDVGEALAKRLEQRGVKAVHSKTIHDYPSFMKAYGPSESTVKAMLTDHPTVQMVFDIHRDADKRDNSLVTIAGSSVARISIVVARGQQDLVQPHWQQNHAFAKLIDARLNQEFPGLSRGIQIVDWRYNQHLHPRSLLMEIGCQENSREEAMRSVELLGDILAQIIAENKS